MNLHLSFQTMILLAYTIPNIYVYLRIRNLFIKKGHRLYYTIIYIILAAIFPLVRYFLKDPEFPLNLLEKFSEYLIPFYLYLFLFTLLFDIFLLFNLLFKILTSEVRRSSKFRRRGLIILISASTAVVVAGAINFHTIRISEYEIDVPARSSSLNKLRIAFAADFHLDENTNIGFVRRFAENISEINPDILLFGGDIAEGEDGHKKMVIFEDILKNIRTKYGVFTVLGNHEYYSGHDDGSFFGKAGIEVLPDSIAIFDNAFNLAGRLDAHSRQRKSAQELFRNVKDSLPVILVDHRPTEINEISKTSADVQFSGHTHHGQMFPLNLILKNMYELSWGYLKKGNTHFFVTSGIRLWGFPVRTVGKSEIMVVNINFVQ